MERDVTWSDVTWTMETPGGKFADLVMFSSENPVRIFMPLGPLYFTNSNDRKINR